MSPGCLRNGIQRLVHPVPEVYGIQSLFSLGSLNCSYSGRAGEGAEPYSSVTRNYSHVTGGINFVLEQLVEVYKT